MLIVYHIHTTCLLKPIQTSENDMRLVPRWWTVYVFTCTAWRQAPARIILCEGIYNLWKWEDRFNPFFRLTHYPD